MNTVTINFVECEPAPALGYNVLWRVAGSNDAYTDAGNYITTPAIFQDNINPDGTDYEGFIRSVCQESGESGVTYGNSIPWTTVSESQTVNFILSAAFNFSIDSVAMTGAPSLPPTGVNGEQEGHHTGVSGSASVNISGSIVVPTKLELSVDAVVVDCVVVIGAGLYGLGPTTATEGQIVRIAVNSGPCS